MASHPLLGFLPLLYYFLLYLSAANETKPENHGKCPFPTPFHCGEFGEIHFPFTNATSPECGLPIRGCENPDGEKQVQLDNNNQTWYKIDSILQEMCSTISFHHPDIENALSSGNFSAFLNNDASAIIIPPGSPVMSFSVIKNITFFTCIHNSNGCQDFGNMTKYTDCLGYDIFYSSEYDPHLGVECPSFPPSKACQIVEGLSGYTDTCTFLVSCLVIEVKLSEHCERCYYQERGQCQLDDGDVHCGHDHGEPPPSAPSHAPAPRGDGQLSKAKIIAASVVGVVVLMVVACCFWTKIFPLKYLLFWKKENTTHQIIETFFKEHGPLPIARYNYSEVRKMTNSFRNKLGEEGHGSVFRGKLHDGRLVAVKVLSQSKGNGEEFINEVASISRTSHVNIVSLMGFCFEGSKKVLIYEFMPNGSLEKFIYEEKNPFGVDCQFDCKTLHDIAVGVARGLEYLHRGCNTRILHFDIKPHNILLDEDFCPKISDFGLAKICPKRESIISILGARGTVGYIAPELCCRNFGEVSHKSDVYSYGIMVLEMVRGRKNVKVQVDRSSEIYFPHWIHKRLELNQDIGLWCVKNESDKEMVKKMIVVSLWCIQTKPSNRPAMSKVVEMLEGSLELLQIPPKPFLSSP